MSEQEERKIIRELEITNYRRFKKLTVEKLARVNLFVGKNNSGKTSLLEAIGALETRHPNAVFNSLFRRNESIPKVDNERDNDEIDFLNLFSGHGLDQEDTESLSFEISSKDSTQTKHTVLCKVVEGKELISDEHIMRLDAPEPTALYFSVSYSSDMQNPYSVAYELESAGVKLSDVKKVSSRLSRNRETYWSTERAVVMVGTGLLNAETLAQLWDNVKLTPLEKEVFDALSIIEHGVDGVGFLGNISTSKLVPVVRINGERVPLGSMGDGMTRVLALVLSLVTAKDGVLLVDEIDTGLHYSVIEDMWRVIIRTAIRLNIQVFATTHSQDCINALAWALENEDEWDDDVVQVHRIEADNEKTVSYSREEIITAARRHIEVR